MNFHNLFKHAEVRRVLVDGTNNVLSAGTSDVNSEIIDTLGYKGIAWIVGMGAIVSTGSVAVKAQQNTANSGTGMADLAGTAQGPSADTDDNKLIIIDEYRPAERYQRLSITRGDGANSTIDFVIAILYHPDHANPVAQGATVYGAEFFANCAEGTA